MTPPPPRNDARSASAPAAPGAGLDPGGPDEAGLRLQIQDHVARYCPRRFEDRRDDIVQVAWLRLTRSRQNDERNRPPGPSLVARVAYCATIDAIRQIRRRREVPVDEVQQVLAAGAADPARATGAREIGQAIRNCLSRLLPGRRLAVTLYLQGHTGPETGMLLGWSLKRAENMIFRGLADLRRCLAGKGVAP